MSKLRLLPIRADQLDADLAVQLLKQVGANRDVQAAVIEQGRVMIASMKGIGGALWTVNVHIVPIDDAYPRCKLIMHTPIGDCLWHVNRWT